eukprot:TRINITY_DN2515_c0_g1_i1.p1 TRINITY_DN2515_c0_g1~~TRINITY_DN2515_c0_g1_i1.p1  ORF type:complete len:348 (-),score=75.09 TRINITY_DN2515_c0_g1_i1:117-1160(-)
MSQPKVIVKVHFMDSSTRAFAIDANATADALLRTVIERIELREHQCFALFERKDNWERCLDPEERPAELQKAWAKEASPSQGSAPGEKTFEEPHFLFKKKIFIRDDEKEMEDPIAKHHLYIQAVSNVISSDYPCLPEEAIKLAGLQAHIVYGDYNATTFQPGFLTNTNDIRKFVPVHLINTKKPAEWEAAIFREHQKHHKKNKDEAKALYLGIVKRWPFYGTTFYPPCKSQNNGRKIPSKVIIGVNAEGILLLKPRDKACEREPISTHPFTEICSWASSSNTFAFEFGTNTEATKYTFATTQGAIIAQTIQTYIDILVDMLTNGADETTDSTATATSMGSEGEEGEV